VAHARQKRAFGAIRRFGGVFGLLQFDDLLANLPLRLGELFGPFRQRLPRAAPFDPVAHRPFEHGRVHVPLHQVILRAFLHGMQGGRLVFMPAEHQHGRFAGRVPRAAERFESAAVGELQIEQHGVDAAARQSFDSSGQRLDVFDLKLRDARRRQVLLDEQGIIRTVFDQQDSDSLEFHG
jgi:hypothetical protein